MRSLPVADIARAYEAVRAQATGGPTQDGPRGLALILDVGLAAWIRTWSSFIRSEVAAMPPARSISAVDPESAELARVLTEMALAARRGAA